jgi:hypothetical protein
MPLGARVKARWSLKNSGLTRSMSGRRRASWALGHLVAVQIIDGGPMDRPTQWKTSG